MSHERLTDFNDLHRTAGLDAVRHQIGNALENFTTGDIPQDEPQPDDGERQQRTGKREKPPIKPAKAYSIADFLSIKLPPRINLLSPWLPAQGLAMVYAPRGIGKTFFGLNVAYAVASEAHTCAGKPKPHAGYVHRRGNARRHHAGASRRHRQQPRSGSGCRRPADRDAGYAGR